MMRPPSQSLVLLPLVFVAWVILFVAWLGASIKGEPVWMPWVSFCSAILLLGGGLALFFRGPAAIQVKRVLLVGGGIGLAVIVVHLLIVEPRQRKENQANNNRLLYERRMEEALTRIHCPSGSVLVIVPGIAIVQGESIRRMLELYLLPADPTKRAVKLANTRYDGKVVPTPALTERLTELLTCFASPGDLHALLQQMEEGIVIPQ